MHAIVEIAVCVLPPLLHQVLTTVRTGDLGPSAELLQAVDTYIDSQHLATLGTLFKILRGLHTQKSKI